MTNSPDVIVLGRFMPSELSPEVIEAEVRPLLPACCRAERLDIRVPQGIAPHPNNLEWHQDGGGVEGTIRHMIVWASEEPTHIKTAVGEFVGESYDLVWFNNDTAWHKQPCETNPNTRWFLGVRCSGTEAPL